MANRDHMRTNDKKKKVQAAPLPNQMKINRRYLTLFHLQAFTWKLSLLEKTISLIL